MVYRKRSREEYALASKKIRRHELIMELVRERGGASVGALSEMLGVSMQTIRRDVDLLCDGQTLRRAHGRIELAAGHVNTPFDQRAGTNLMGKRAIASVVASQIPNGATLFMSIGSTPLTVARALRYHKELTVITNNLSVAMALSEELSNRIILPGGELRLPDRDFVGEEVVSFFNRYRAEFAVFGTAGVAEDGRLLEFHEAEVRASEAMRMNAQRSILVIDSSKFGRLAPAAGAMISEVSEVICDHRPDVTYDPVVEMISDRISFVGITE